MNEPMQQQYTISELAQLFDITTRTIRFYESEELLKPQRDGQKRIYNQKDYITLKLVLRGRRLGWSLAESRELIQLYDPTKNNQKQYKQVLHKIEESRQKLHQQLTDIQIMLNDLEEHESQVIQVMKK